jgi:hypothetical protein
MGAIVFDNMPFDYWLTQKSQEILSKADKEKITTEDLIILTLKAQTNHFHHMDVEFRDEFKKIDKKFDRLYSALMWGFGLMITMTFGLYIKLFLG